MSTGDFRKKAAHIPIAREGVPYLLAAVFTTLVTAILGWATITVVFLILTLLMGHFFRDPERIVSAGPQDVLAPAEGKIISIERVEENRFIKRPCIRISTFMSVFNVHVNRVPFSGEVQDVLFEKGRFFPAGQNRALKENEKAWVWIKTDSDTDVVMTQVAGLIARRIVCWPTAGDRVIRGERFGMIRFGSRMDVYVPEDSEITTEVGRNVYGGETVICRLK